MGKRSDPTMSFDETGDPVETPAPPERGILAPGERIGDWIVEASLGEGGMGAVYRCRNVLTDAVKSAVKVLKPHNLGDAKKRFVREINLLATVKHPAVVAVFGGGEDETRGLLYFAMEYLEGETLDARMERGAMPWEEVKQIFAQLADGLNEAHGKGVVHRDIKPQNVMICAGGDAKLIDFGIAVGLGGTQLTRGGVVPGTVAYMAPETFTGTKPDHRGDIYALGLMMWECLTGERAYPESPDSTPAQSVAQIMGAKLTATPYDPGDRTGTEIRELVRRCTAPDPEDRLSGLGEFLAVLSGRPLDPASTAVQPRTNEKRPPAPRRTGSETGWGPILMVLGLVGLVLVVVVAGVVGAGAVTVGGLTALIFMPGEQQELVDPWSDPYADPYAQPFVDPYPSDVERAVPAPAVEVPPTPAPVPVPAAEPWTWPEPAPALDPWISPSPAPALDTDWEPIDYGDAGFVPTQQIPDGFPFASQLDPDYAIVIGTVNQDINGQNTWLVTYTTANADGQAIVGRYAAAFRGRGLLVSETSTTLYNGTNWLATGYGPAETAAAASIPNYLGGTGQMVTVSWTPNR